MSNILEIKNVSKSFGGLEALGDINLEVEEGDLVGIAREGWILVFLQSPLISGAISTAISSSQPLQPATFWQEKRIPVWMRYGLASYCERYFSDAENSPQNPWALRDWAIENLSQVGWEPGKHVGADEERRPDPLTRGAGRLAVHHHRAARAEDPVEDDEVEEAHQYSSHEGCTSTGGTLRRRARW